MDFNNEFKIRDEDFVFIIVWGFSIAGYCKWDSVGNIEDGGNSIAEDCKV